MKRLLLIFAMVSMAAFVTSCEADDNRLRSTSSTFTVYETDWKWNPDRGCYFFEFPDVMELTPYVLENGLYNMYYIWKDNNIFVQEPMPAIVYHRDPDGYLWEYTLSCDYSRNTIIFYAQYSDKISRRPETVDFRLVVLQ